jgi:ABC-type Fe3+/spermidine/putrescine transport system ATPase subunit
VGYLCLRNLIKSYDGKTNAVDDVTIDIERGEFITFLGPSGSGKTTTLMMIAGFETPTSGMIELAARDLALSKPYQRNIGMVFQNYALFPHMTAAKNVIFPLKMRRFPRADMQVRAEKILALVGLSRFADRYPRELSGGQQQRVALARGLVFNPDVLLLDEPLGALDKNLREQMQVEIKRIHREVGITMIYVTHDQTEAMTMSDRVAVFSNGRIEQVGSPLDVYNKPVNRFVGRRDDAKRRGRPHDPPGTPAAAPGRRDRRCRQHLRHDDRRHHQLRRFHPCDRQDARAAAAGTHRRRRNQHPAAGRHLAARLVARGCTRARSLIPVTSR